jgi:phosphoglycerate dehydrogenase-like enzyme
MQSTADSSLNVGFEKVVGEYYAVKILVPHPYVERIEAMRKLFGPDFEVIQSGGALDDLLEKGSDADVLVSMRVPGEYIHAAPNLKMIQSMGTGIDRIDLQRKWQSTRLPFCWQPRRT